MYFALRDELWSYLEHVTDKFELGPRIRFETEVESALYHAWYRMRLGWTFSDRMHPALQKDPSWPHPDRSLNAINDAQRTYFTQYIESELGDRTELLDLVVPPYPPFGKRMLLDNGWYRMLRNDRVLLVADPVVEIGPDRIITENGNEHPADVLVLATGFDVLRFLTSFEARGRSGRSLREVWDDDDARAFLGLAIPDFPNFFCLYGPNTQPGAGGSLIFVIEMQMRLHHGHAAEDGSPEDRRCGMPPGRPRRVQRAHRSSPREHGLDPQRDADLLSERARPRPRELSVSQTSTCSR